MPTWYVVKPHSNNIESVTVVEESRDFVTYLEPYRFANQAMAEFRSKKVTRSHRFFPTRKEALAYLIERTSNRLNTASKQCHELKQALMELVHMHREEENT